MKDLKAQKIIENVIKGINKNGIESEAVVAEVAKLRKMAKAENDPLLIRATRMIIEHIEENEGFEIAILEDSETQEENLVYAFELLSQSENKYNREEIREFADLLVDS